jgi:hypothetical protein
VFDAVYDQAARHFAPAELAARVRAIVAINGWTRAPVTARKGSAGLPGRITRAAWRSTMHLPARWPWQSDFIQALTRIRALPAA